MGASCPRFQLGITRYRNLLHDYFHYTKFCFLNWSDMRDQRLGPVQHGILCVRHVSITSLFFFLLFFQNEDKIGRGGLWTIKCLPGSLLSWDGHVIVMWLFGPIRARLTFCGYRHVSMSSLFMLIAATGRCRCLQIWIREFVHYHYSHPYRHHRHLSTLSGNEPKAQ